MKKFMLVCAALLFSAVAFAQEVKQEAPKGPEFKYGVWANAFAITENTAAKNLNKEYSEIRVRPMFTMGMDNVSVVTRFEIDQYFGSGGSTAVQGNGSGSNAGYADPDGDQIAVEVKWAYINVKDFFITGLTATAGLAPYVYSIGYNNDMPQFNLVYDAGVVKVDLAYVKVEESDLTTETSGVPDKDDVQMYSAKLPVKIGFITITPAVLYAKGERDRTLPTLTGTESVDTLLGYYGSSGDLTKTMPSIAIAVNTGDFSFTADFVYIMGENKSYDKDYKAYAGYVTAGYKASDALSFNLFGIYTTGQDSSNDVTSFQAACGDELEVGPLFIINDNGYINQVGVTNEYDKATEGLMAYGIGVNFKSGKFAALVQLAYATTTSNDIIKDKAIGTEGDLRLAYEVGPKTSFWVEGAYIKAGKYIEDKNASTGDQDPMYYAAGILTAF